MKTKIAAILILIYGFFATAFIIFGLSNVDHCGIKEPIPPYGVPALLYIAIPLLIAAYSLLIKETKFAWWTCIVLIPCNIGVLCWAIKFFLGISCYEGIQILPDKGAADISIAALVIITFSLFLLLLDIKRINRITISRDMKTGEKPDFTLIIFIVVAYILFTTVLIIGLTSPVYDSCKRMHYYYIRDELQNSIAYYMSDSNNSSQLPILNENAIFTLTNPNGSYYIINISPLLTSNGGFLGEVPNECIEIPGPDNDNCDGGAIGCSNTSHYIWGVDNEGNVVSKFVNSSEMNICQCNTCDGYQGVWP